MKHHTAKLVSIALACMATLLAPVGRSTASVLGCHSFHKT